MALGKIKADTLEHSTAGTVDTQYVVNGSAKAWINALHRTASSSRFTQYFKGLQITQQEISH
jgi:hypothetical protein